MVHNRNYLREIQQLTDKTVHVKDEKYVNDLINKIVSDGFQVLHILSDFDRTVTKQKHNGERHISSFGMMAHCPSVTPEYLKAEEALCHKYLPLENDFTIPQEQREKYMEEWWRQTEEILKGLKITKREIEDTARELGSSLRDGINDMFNLLCEKGVPVLVFSAGMGDMIESVLAHHGLFLPNVKVVSNFLKYDEVGNIVGFKQEPIQVFNKNEDHLQEFGYNALVENRDNIILLGDSIGDATMVGHNSNKKTVLKIGFLNNAIEKPDNNNLPRYLEVFDMVLIDDDTMDVPKAILNLMS